ncbi:MalM family protein [Vibrio proteolyticus]|uniref:MalM protein n=1 Tax=Vibrio proteolyticus NBRC 13287 TaxID=1219065 RepID=U3A2V5_VIBPR|nr:MalM family protein [Vibrio proteolyticus]GAD68020.1 MalM protein [Vibrio proteolyticus NBRC 13287]
MKKWLAPVILGMLVTGCTTPQQVAMNTQGSQQVITQSSEINWLPLDVPTVTEFALTDKSQMLLNGDSAGAIAAFTLPGNRGSLDIKLESFVSKDLQFFAPTMVIYNSVGEVIYQADFAKFQYEPAKLLDNDKFVLDMNVIPETSGGDMQVLIYTTADDLKGSSQVLHPAKAFAMARHTQPPDIADPMAKHAPLGQFRLIVSANDIVTSKLGATNDNIPQGTDLTSYYHNAIKKAVEADDIPKALGLLDEAKALDIQGAQEVFVKAVNSK